MTAVPRLPPGLEPFCLGFLDLLERWNRRQSLTALPPGARREELLLDAAALLPWLERLPPGARVADFGTGMGVPALVLAAARPDLEVAAVDRSTRKLAFVRQAALELGLANLRTHAGAAEDLPPLEADLGTAKAVGTLDLLLGWWARHGRPGAPFLALKGPSWREELPVPGWTCEAADYRLPTRGARVVVVAVPEPPAVSG